MEVKLIRGGDGDGVFLSILWSHDDTSPKEEVVQLQKTKDKGDKGLYNLGGFWYLVTFVRSMPNQLIKNNGNI